MSSSESMGAGEIFATSFEELTACAAQKETGNQMVSQQPIQQLLLRCSLEKQESSGVCSVPAWEPARRAAAFGRIVSLVLPTGQQSHCW